MQELGKYKVREVREPSGRHTWTVWAGDRIVSGPFLNPAGLQMRPYRQGDPPEPVVVVATPDKPTTIFLE